MYRLAISGDRKGAGGRRPRYKQANYKIILDLTICNVMRYM